MICTIRSLSLISLVLALCLPSSFQASAEESAQTKWNILLFVVDDMGWDSPGCFGGKTPDITPNIDKLASEGMRLMRSHVTVAVCQPSRQCMMTGQFPFNMGAPGFNPIDESEITLQEVLHEAGYKNGIMCKEHHLKPVNKYKWDMIKRSKEMAQGRNPGYFHKYTKEFIEQAQADSSPFFLMVNSEDPHRPLHGDKADQKWRQEHPDISMPSRVYKPEEVDIPPFLHDIPGMREELACYYSSVRRGDDSVGAVLKALDECGVRDTTIVIFLSDNGMPFISAKWNTYDQSTRTPMIVRWPGVVKPNSVDDEHFVNGVDFMPTVLEALGLPAPEGMDGKSYLPVLKGKKQQGREHIITLHCEAYNSVVRGPARERWINELGWRRKGGAVYRDMNIRCIRNKDYAYIYNEWSDGTVFFYIGGGGAHYKKAAKDNPAWTVRREFMRFRTPQELYLCQDDAGELENQFANPAHAGVMKELQAKLLAWMEATGDPALKGFREKISSP